MQGMYEIREYQLEAGYSTMGTVVDLLAKGCAPSPPTSIALVYPAVAAMSIATPSCFCTEYCSTQLLL